MRRAALPLVFLALACACVGPTTRRARFGDGAVRELAEDQLRTDCRWRACVLAEPGTMSEIVAGGVREAFAEAKITTDMGGGRNCDVGFRYKSIAWADRADVLSAYTGEVLFSMEANFRDGAKLACALLQPDADAGRKLAAQRGEPPAAPLAAERPPALAPPPLSSDVDVPSYKSPPSPDDFAVIVGVEEYSDLPKAQYAERDAAAFKRHALALGIPERNVVHLAGPKAVKSSLEKYVEQWLPRLVNEKSRVLFYFSGHGAPDVKTGAAYLVPWDGDPNFLETTGYPVKRLYDKLGALGAKEVLVAMDSCFSGAGGRSVLPAGARPLVARGGEEKPGGRIVALTAAGGGEISGALDAEAHGAFTYFLLKGLSGAAADGKGRVTARSLHGYLLPRVQDEARRLNRDQTPQLLGASELVLR